MRKASATGCWGMIIPEFITFLTMHWKPLKFVTFTRKQYHKNWHHNGNCIASWLRLLGKRGKKSTQIRFNVHMKVIVLVGRENLLLFLESRPLLICGGRIIYSWRNKLKAIWFCTDLELETEWGTVPNITYISLLAAHETYFFPAPGEMNRGKNAHALTLTGRLYIPSFFFSLPFFFLFFLEYVEECLRKQPEGCSQHNGNKIRLQGKTS